MATQQAVYPWFTDAWSELNVENMPHALLIHGQPGIGKFDFALHIAKAILCESSDLTQPCCNCEACHWFDTGNHPDFLGLVPEFDAALLPHDAMAGSDGAEDKPKRGKKKAEEEGEKADKKASAFIKVEQVREALEGINTAPHRGRKRVVLLSPVEALQAVSANTLLKTLEEPPESTLFLLVTDRLDRILPTIRSRCRLLALSRPTKEVALSWLAQQTQDAGLKASAAQIEQILGESGGAVMDARDRLLGLKDTDEADLLMSQELLKSLADGPRIDWLKAAELCFKAPMPLILLTLERWTADVLSQQQSGQIRFYPGKSAEISRCAQAARGNKLSDFWRSLLDARRHELHALANRVQIESLLIRYQDIFK